MKAILAFAILVIVAQANPAAYHSGFADQLGLTNEQLSHGQECFDAIRTVAEEIHMITHAENPRDLLESALLLVNDADYKLKRSCLTYLEDVVLTVFKNVRAPLAETASQNWNKYAVEIIHLVAVSFDAIKAGNFYEAGKTEAYLLQVLFGAETPEAFVPPHFNYENAVPMDNAKYVKEMTQSFYKTLRLDNTKGANDNTECLLAQFSFFEVVPNMNYWNYLEASSKARITEQLISSVVTMYDTCISAVAFNFNNIAVPIGSAFHYSPIHATFQVLHNVAIHLPEFRQNALQTVVDTMEGRYEKVGEAWAEMLIAVVENIYSSRF